MIHCVLHDPKDSVAVVVVEGVKAGTTLTGLILDEDRTITLPCVQDIPLGHKVALKDMARRRHRHQVRRRHRQGRAADQATGSTPTSTTSRPSAGEQRPVPPMQHTAKSIHANTFWGYRRENGRVGVRNHVIVLPVDDLSNAAAEAVAHNIKGTMAIPHPYGRLQFGADLDLHFRTLIGTGSNPNVAAVVVIGIEEQWTKKVVDGIAATGKPVAGFGIELHGDHDTIMRASKAAREYLQWASEKQRVECALKELWVSTKCGESDTTSGCGANPTVGDAFDKLYAAGCTLVFGETTELTGGEQIVAARCRDDTVRAEFMRVFDRYQEVINRHKTSRPVRLAADQGQHRRRPDDDRGKGARQHPEDRQEVRRRRRARQGRDADAVPACGSWTARRRRPRWSRCARRRATSCISSRPGRATSSATRSCR